MRFATVPISKKGVFMWLFPEGQRDKLSRTNFAVPKAVFQERRLFIYTTLI